jgi:hypothetical protein
MASSTATSTELITLTADITKIITETTNTVGAVIGEIPKIKKIIDDLRAKSGSNDKDLATLKTNLTKIQIDLTTNKEKIQTDLQAKLQQMQTTPKTGGKNSAKKQMANMMNYMSKMMPQRKTQKKHRKH